MKILYLSLKLWRWNPVVAVRRIRDHSPYDNFDFKTAMRFAHTLLI